MPHNNLVPETLFSPQRPANEKIFVGRENILNKLAKGCRSGLSYGIVGKPGLGKTSLLYALQRQLRFNTPTDSAIISFPVYIEYEKAKYKICEDILEIIQKGFVTEIEKSTGLMFSSELIKGNLRLSFEDNLRFISDWYFKEARRVCKLVLLFDDVHRGYNLIPLAESFSVLRPIVANGEMAVILCGEMALEKEFRNDVSFLRNLVVEQIPLSPLSKKDVNQILAIVEDYHGYVETNVLDLLYDITGGHPYRIHYYLLEALRSYSKISIEGLKNISSDKTIKLFLENVLKENQPDQTIEETKMTKILFLAADPSNETRLRLGEEQREIENGIQMGKERKNITFTPKTSVRPKDISQALLDITPKIVHFSGHGTQSGQLCFEDNTGNSHPVEPEALANLFDQFRDNIECVVLNACFSESQANAIAKSIPYVIGMKKEIGDKAAIAFSIGFYKGIAAGQSIDKAYNLGCIQIGMQTGMKQSVIPILIKKR